MSENGTYICSGSHERNCILSNVEYDVISKANSIPKRIVLKKKYNDYESAIPSAPTSSGYEFFNVDIGNKNDQMESVAIRPNSLFWKPVGQSKSKDKLLKRKYLSQMGLCPPDDLKCVQQNKKDPIVQVIVDMVRKIKYPDVVVRINNTRYPCHMCILQCYSDYFKEYNLNEEIILPEDFITIPVFDIIYKWMLKDSSSLPYEHLVDLFYASGVLKIPELTKVCWSYFDCDTQHLREDQAMFLYLQSRKYDLQDLKKALLQRMNKFFLTLVASKEYLEMTPNEIVSLLSGNKIGVNTEVEVFMAAMRWLNHNRKERERYVADILKTVRFGVIPAWYLLQIQNKSLNSPEIEWIADNPSFKEMSKIAMIYSVAYQHYSGDRESFYEFLNQEGMDRINERQYVFDKGCIYHHRLRCSRMHVVSYPMFQRYLREIAVVGKNYWLCLENLNIDLPCTCSKTLKKKMSK